ncbi:MAG: NAD(P)H-dependent oxidoreductase [Verrucomicrobiota bacterium]
MSYILHLDASGRQNGSASRESSATHAAQLSAETGLPIRTRDLSQGLPFVNETMIVAYFTAEDDRSEEQRASLTVSDELVDELLGASHLVLGTPIYNFSVPAALKAWIDLVTRMGRTVNYEDGRPVGLVENVPATVHVAAGGTAISSKRDFATPWLKTALGYIGISEIEFWPATEAATPE